MGKCQILRNTRTNEITAASKTVCRYRDDKLRCQSRYGKYCLEFPRRLFVFDKKSEKIQFFDAYEVKPRPEFEATVLNGVLKIGNSVFKKVDTTGFIEKKYWIGKYSTQSGNIELKYDGKISGVDSLVTFYVWSDYVTTQTDIDLIDLNANSSKSTTYGYKLTENEIIFYEFIWSEEGVIGKAGKEVFRWKKK